MSDIDVTDWVAFHGNDDEHLPLVKCVCGQRFQAWDFILGIYREWAKECPNCGRKLYFRNDIRVYEVEHTLPAVNLQH
jgi:hypothetical protein